MIGHPGFVFKETTTSTKVAQSDEEGMQTPEAVREK